MERKTRLFTQTDLKKIETAIVEAEKATSGEILVVVSRASGDYRWVSWVWAALGVVAASIVLLVREFKSGWSPAVAEVLEWQVAGALAFTLLSLWDRIRNLTIPRKVAALHVHRECLATFTAAGLHETRGRSGILIYVSELEERVQILADRGIHGEKGNEYWQSEIVRIVEGIRAGRAAEGLCAAIESMGRELERHYPRHPDDKNELPNAVLLGPLDIPPRR